MTSNNKRIVAVVDGHMGAGKTKITEEVVRQLPKCIAIFEPDESKNQYLTAQYEAVVVKKDKSSPAPFLAQRQFMLLRAEAERAMLTNPDSDVAIDRSSWGDEAFFSHYKAIGHISDEESVRYFEERERVRLLLPPYDFLVYLETSIPTLIERILSKRGRSFEAQIDEEFLAGIQHQYDTILAKLERSFPVYRLPYDDDSVTIAMAAEEVIRIMERHRRGVVSVSLHNTKP